MSGRTLGDYQLLRRLGRGGMAEVYLAEQRSLRRQVALKVLRDELAKDPSLVQRFSIEAQAAASFVHPHVVQIYEVGHLDGIRFIAQEYVQGQNLMELIQRGGPPELPLALRVMRHVAAALHQAELHGVVHRDIKPENILISRSGDVKVADFGLARLTREPQPVNLTQVGVTMGTPLYMSPEQIEGRQLDPRSDIYSFGVTCFHMLAGEPPFRGDTPLAVALQHLHHEPPRLENARPDLPPALCRIVHRALAKDRGQRYGSALEILHELRSIRGPEMNDADWEELGELLSSSKSAAAVTERLEATQQLDAVLKGQLAAQPRRPRWFLPLWAATVATALILGVVVALVQRPAALLSGAATGSSVPLLKTAEEQFFLAETLRTPDAYRAVLEHFPTDARFASVAQRRLAMSCVLSSDYPSAVDQFEKLAASSELDKEDRAFGLAGLTVVLALRGEHSAAAAKLAELAGVRDALDDREMLTLLDRAVRDIRAALNKDEAQKWESWSREHFDRDDD